MRARLESKAKKKGTQGGCARGLDANGAFVSNAALLSPRRGEAPFWARIRWCLHAPANLLRCLRHLPRFPPETVRWLFGFLKGTKRVAGAVALTRHPRSAGKKRCTPGGRARGVECKRCVASVTPRLCHPAGVRALFGPVSGGVATRHAPATLLRCLRHLPRFPPGTVRRLFGSRREPRG